MATYKVIDVSDHRKKIDWKKVKADGIVGAIIRYADGETLDVRFEENMKGATAVGLHVGAYIYSRAKTKARAETEATRLFNACKPYNLDMPLYIDLEAKGLEKTADTVAAAFLNKMKELGGRGGVYANLNWWNNYLKKTAKNYSASPFWIAQYNRTMDYKPASVMGMWQYSNSGKVRGISGNVDMDKCYIPYWNDVSVDVDVVPAVDVVIDVELAKTVDELAWEVLKDKWGTGDERKKLITEAGYDYDAVQKRVNELVPLVEKIAEEVIAGDKWGNGDERKRLLTEAGYDYDVVQKKVNELLVSPIGRLANSYAYTTNDEDATYPDGKPTTAYKQALDKAYPDRSKWGVAPRKGASCDVFVGTCVRNAGVDKSFPRGLNNQITYLAKSDKFKEVSVTKDTAKDGDIIVYTKTAGGGHICIVFDGKIKEAGFEHYYPKTTDTLKSRLSESGKNWVKVYRVVNKTVKTIDELAYEVLDGVYGNGDDRKKKLTEKGYDYDAVQKRVNEIVAFINKMMEACKAQAEWSKNSKYEWQSNPTIEKSKDKETCVTFTACVLQRIGYLASGKYIWHNKTGKVIGANDKFTVIYPVGKTLRQLKDELKAGDIIMDGDKADLEGGSHIFIFTGKWQGDNPIVWDQRSAQAKGGKSYAYSRNRNVIAIVRPKK